MLQPVEHFAGTRFPALMGFVSHGTGQLLQLVRAPSQLHGDQEGGKLAARHKVLQEDQQDDQEDWNDADKYVSDYQPPAEPPEDAVPDEPHQASQVVKADGDHAGPKEDPQ